MTDNTSIYTEEFYDANWNSSFPSAVAMLKRLLSIWRPRSVVDVGCGRGAWLVACERYGVTDLVGLDGPWLTQQEMKSGNIQFHPTNIEEPFSLPRLFDLAITVEVAEHVRPENSDVFFRSLTGLADAVVFGAAFTGQPGNNHVNTRDHSFWCNKFLCDGYLIFDFFRPRVWGAPEIAPFYQQNTFLFVRPNHPLFTALISAAERPMENPRFVDAVHPWLYNVHLRTE